MFMLCSFDALCDISRLALAVVLSPIFFYQCMRIVVHYIHLFNNLQFQCRCSFSFLSETNDLKIKLMNASNTQQLILRYFSVILAPKGKQRENIMITPNIYENSEPTTPTSIYPDGPNRKYYRKAAHR